MALVNSTWEPGTAPVSVVMISLNEAHNMEAVLENLKGWAQEVFLVDSCSTDATVDIALRYGVHVVQRPFRGFGDQWNFALRELPICAPWTMKLDPDERLSDSLKQEIIEKVEKAADRSFTVPIRLYFMGKRLSSVLRLLRLWKTGTVQFSDVQANEHAISEDPPGILVGEVKHMDSPSLDHWVVKQNRYTTAEAISQSQNKPLAVPPKLFGNALERRMWLKRNFWKVPGRYLILFGYHFFVLGAWKAGKVGWIWSHLRTEVYRQWEYKRFEIEQTGRLPTSIPSNPGEPDSRVRYYE
ncbi:glycosyltransferase family 2 protein [Marinobacter profundi]|uniref:Glycosyl transferase n=1 Tax=Marinobacter profundi TaxID=2666256 RepID=A0A2G1UIZ9_9GAMM|nr:glycosyltransferase family 2 protein [Marinobacter profundi]PHQ14457.1 glycosyl transferase [Marinobacter profundi]